MGEVRVKTKLINAFDEKLARKGQISPEQIRTYEADALVDRGAVSSVLPIYVVQKLGLDLVRRERAEYANGSAEDVEVTEPVGLEISGRRVTEETLVLGDEVLIGQTALERMDLLVDCNNRRLLPNPAHPDQPVLKIK